MEPTPNTAPPPEVSKNTSSDLINGRMFTSRASNWRARPPARVTIDNVGQTPAYGARVGVSSCVGLNGDMVDFDALEIPFAGSASMGPHHDADTPSIYG